MTARFSRRLLVFFVATLVLAGSSGAEEWRFSSAGLLGGPSLGGREDYTQLDAIINVETPLTYEIARLRTAVELQLSAGALSSGDETGLIAAFGPLIRFTHADLPLYLDVASRPTLLTRTRMGREDLGGPFSFTSHVALGVVAGKNGRLRLGYRAQHTSNAGIYSENPGVNIHGLLLELRF